MKKLILISILAMTVVMTSNAQNKETDLKNYFSISEVSFANRNYNLAWSSHPNDIYYKQEYLPIGEKSESYKTMIMIEAIILDAPIQKVVGLKESELQERKKTDPVCNYQITTNSQTGEYMIDFLMSSGDIVEWNSYRYKKIVDSKGNPTILLFALSRRAYGDEITSFLTKLTRERIDYMNLVWDYKLPTINFKN